MNSISIHFSTCKLKGLITKGNGINNYLARGFIELFRGLGEVRRNGLLTAWA